MISIKITGVSGKEYLLSDLPIESLSEYIRALEQPGFNGWEDEIFFNVANIEAVELIKDKTYD